MCHAHAHVDSQSRHQQGLCMRISASKKPKSRALLSYFTKAHGIIYQFAIMKENVHRGAHALTGLMFAPSVIMF